MISLVALGTALTLAAPPALAARSCVPLAPGPDAADLRALYESGQSFDAFLTDADARRELWDENWEISAMLDPALLGRAAAVGGQWHFLAVAVAGCSDSVNTIPFLARIAERSDNITLRIVDSDVGAEVMSAHRTPDGRGATPTVVLMNADFEEVGCFIERPRWLRDHTLANPDGLDRRELYDWKMEWYAEDRGRSTAREFVEMLEAAASGSVQCASRSQADHPSLR